MREKQRKKENKRDLKKYFKFLKKSVDNAKKK